MTDIDAHSRSASAPRHTVLVMHFVPAYRYGLALGLKEAGFDVREAEPEDPGVDIAWDACLLQHDGGRTFGLLAELRRRRPRTPVVMLISETRASAYRRALLADAAGVVAHDADIEEIVDVVRAALAGRVSLPAHILPAVLTAPAPSTPDWLKLTAEETQWLHALAHGESVSAIARLAGYSERQMYRMLEATYGRLRATTRMEAIVQAARWGVIPVSE